MDVMAWLLDDDPAIRWQVLRDLEGARVGPGGRWPLDRVHPGRVHFDIEEVGAPSRWNTLRAVRVLAWWDASA